MPASFGHSNHGINLTNYRVLSSAAGRKMEAKGGYRAPYDWQMETNEQLGLGTTENKLSSTLRDASQALQSNANHQLASDLSNVEDALKTKISQTHTLKSMLESGLMDVLNEIGELVALRGKLEERQAKVQVKMDVSSERMQARTARPARERTMDEVERNLINQQGLLGAFSDKVRRAVAQLDRECSQLDAVRAKLEADLRDKIEAIRVDEAVLAVAMDPSVEGTMSPSFRKDHICHNKTCHTWMRSTEENLRLAHQWLADSARLRKAIQHTIQSSRVADHKLATSLNNAMVSKVGATQDLHDSLEAKLGELRNEQARALQQRGSLADALEAKRGPLAQAKERLAVRKGRPCRETVADDVEAALAREIAHLASVTTSLSDKVFSVDRELAQLDAAAAVIEQNIRDKEVALSVDQQMVMLDGRLHLASPPPSSVASFAFSDMSAPRTATLARIRDLEEGLAVARREREGMESTIRQLRDTLGPEGEY